jgi:hypothetical protein
MWRTWFCKQYRDIYVTTTLQFCQKKKKKTNTSNWSCVQCLRHASVDIDTHGYIQIVHFHNLLMVSTYQCRIYYLVSVKTHSRKLWTNTIHKPLAAQSINTNKLIYWALEVPQKSCPYSVCVCKYICMYECWCNQTCKIF